MPITYHRAGKVPSAERAYQTFLDWVRKIMQLATLATILLYAYLFYGLLVGDVGHWGTMDAANKARIALNIQNGVLAVNIALGLLLVTACILFYDEQSLGYTLVAASVFFYFGVPYLFEAALSQQLQEWNRTHNTAALAIFNQLRMAGLLLAIPGGILVVRDLIVRALDGSQRKHDAFRAMQYGGQVKAESPVGSAPIGMFAKCWQMAYCREAIRKRCPIFHARTRCWRERVGCMCEENVIRHAMDALINKQAIGGGPLLEKEEAPVGMTLITGEESPDDPDKTGEFPERAFVPPVDRKRVKIPHNPNLSMAAKMERCRNCVIYNEHQRLKYQFFAPLFVLAMPALAYMKLDDISKGMDAVLLTVDKVMQNLALVQNPNNAGIASSLTSTNVFAKYMVLGSMIVILTTMALRFLEYCVFKLKI